MLERLQKVSSVATAGDCIIGQPSSDPWGPVNTSHKLALYHIILHYSHGIMLSNLLLCENI